MQMLFSLKLGQKNILNFSQGTLHATLGTLHKYILFLLCLSPFRPL